MQKMKFLKLITIFLISLFPNLLLLNNCPVYAFNECKQIFIQKELEKNHYLLAENNFIHNRGIKEYGDLLGENLFPNYLNNNLGPDKHWIDIGIKILIDYKFQFSPENRAQVTSITYNPGKIQTPSLTDGINIHSGKLVEELEVTKIEKADLITDVYGALHYSKDITLVLEQYGKLLNEGGIVWTHIPVKTIFSSENGKTVTSLDFFKMIKGFNLSKLESSELSGAIWLIRTNESLKIPKLELIDFVNGKPPFREFKILEVQDQKFTN
jgi:hypothetical protein